MVMDCKREKKLGSKEFIKCRDDRLREVIGTNKDNSEGSEYYCCKITLLTPVHYFQKCCKFIVER